MAKNDELDKPTAPKDDTVRGDTTPTANSPEPAISKLEGTESQRRNDAKIPVRSTLTSVDLGTSPATNAELVAKANRAANDAFNKVMTEGNVAPDGDTLFEVMVDTWGFNPIFERGTLLKASDIPYNIAAAEGNGTIRRAPEYQDSDVPHATMPLDNNNRIDADAQRNPRTAAGATP